MDETEQHEAPAPADDGSGGPDRDTLVRMYEIQTTIKQCDERFRSMLMGGQIQLIYYSPRGQECISAGYAVHLRPDDYVVTTYRGLHDHLAKGVPLRELWAEFLGKATGTCKGKGGPMHITHPASGLMVTTGIVGGGIPIANGLALAAQLDGTDRVTVVNFGDGATNIGAFHEAPEHGRGVEAAGGVRLPEQPVRRAHAAADGHRRSTGSPTAARPTTWPRRHRRRQRPGRHVRTPLARPWPGPGRGRGRR